MSMRGLAQGAAIIQLLLQSALAAPVTSNNFNCFDSVEAILEEFELTAAQQVLEQTDFLRLFRLSPNRPITLFLPEDAALAPVLDSQGGVIGLGSNLVQVLMLNHISFDAGHFSYTLDAGDTIQTGLGLADIQCPLDSGELTWTGEGLQGVASQANVVESDLVPCNTKLVIHIIDDVLIPNCEIGRGISLIELLTGEALSPEQVDDIQAALEPALTPASGLPPLPTFEPGPTPAPETPADARALEPSLASVVEPAAVPAFNVEENIAPGPAPILSAAIEPAPALTPELEPTALAPTAVEPTVEPALGPEAVEPVEIITPEEGLAPEDMEGPVSGLEIEPEELFPDSPPAPADGPAGDRGQDEFKGPAPTPSVEPEEAEVPEPAFAPPPLEEDYDDFQCEETVLEMLENFVDTDLLIDYFREHFASQLNDPDKAVTVFLPLNDTTLDFVSRRLNTSTEDGFQGLNSTYQEALASIHIIPNITANSSEFRTGQTIRDTLLKETGIDQCSGSLDIKLIEQTSTGVIARTSTQVYITASGEPDRDIWVAHTNLFTCSGKGVIHVLRYPLIPKCRGLELGPQKEEPAVTGQLDESLAPPPEEVQFFDEDTNGAGLGSGVSVVVAILAARLSLNWLTW